MANEQKYQVNKHGYYGQFGGAYIPEMLHPNIEELQQRYMEIIYDEKFQDEFRSLLKDYVGKTYSIIFCKKTIRAFQYQHLFKTRRSLPYRSS